MMKALANLLLLASILTAFPAVLQAQDNNATDIGTRRELFVDRALVEKIEGGAQLRMHHPIARELAMTHDAPWEGTSSGYHTAFRDGDTYRLYYRGLHIAVREKGISTGKHAGPPHRPVRCRPLSTDRCRTPT